MSQLELASAAGVSSRHLSFIETGRAKPSREMVVHLAEQLDVPLRARNNLLTAALAPSALVETLIVAGGCGALAIATDRIRPWPWALAVPAAVAVLLHVADLALGSDLLRRSLLGPNPVLGSRFFGAGNEIEITLAVIGLLGLGGALATAAPRTRVWGFAVGGGVLAFTLAWGRLGADVGAVPTVIAGATVAALATAGAVPWRWRIAILLVAPVVGLAALALLDLATGGDAHFSRSVLEAGGLHDIADIAERRVRLSYRSLGRGELACERRLSGHSFVPSPWYCFATDGGYVAYMDWPLHNQKHGS